MQLGSFLLGLCLEVHHVSYGIDVVNSSHFFPCVMRTPVHFLLARFVREFPSVITYSFIYLLPTYLGSLVMNLQHDTLL